MTIFNPPKFVTRSLMGAVGLSAIAFFGVAESAKGFNINAGTDYLHTPPGGTFYDFGTVEIEGNQFNIGEVELIGDRVGPGKTDTKIKRLQDAKFDEDDDGVLEREEVKIDIEVTLLSLKSKNSVEIGDDEFDVFINLTENTPSLGTMTITHNTFESNGQLFFDDTQSSDGRFTSDFTVNFDAIFQSVNSDLEFTVSDSLRLINSGADWSHNVSPDDQVVKGDLGDLEANCHVPKSSIVCHPGDFFPGPANHTKADGSPLGHGTRVAATPEPLTILGSVTAIGFGTFFKRKLGKKRQQNKA